MSIGIESVTVQYKNQVSLRDINLYFRNGEQWAIYGPNGAGKSTLLKTIIGLIDPDQGRIDLRNLTLADIAYLDQNSHLDINQPLNVFELVALGLWHEISFYQGLSTEQKERVFVALNQVDLVDLAKKQVHELSKGQLQKAFFARILVQKAKYLLLDEPFNAMDSNTISQLLKLIVFAQENNKGIIAVIHDQTIIQSYFPHTVILNVEVKYQGPTNNVDFRSCYRCL